MINCKIPCKNMDSAIRAAYMFELSKNSTISIIDGKFKDARKYQKAFAKFAVEDFDTSTALPNFHFNTPPKLGLRIMWQYFKFGIFRAFTKKSPEEKQLAAKYKDYIKNTPPEERKKNTIDITIPSLY